ncbi:MAG TPA: hypothetical protein VK324_02645, partial [Tepidisphaeraceae bacterium]|nr:hypothetical protein [Tepidisphaeraceae bacterium]
PQTVPLRELDVPLDPASAAGVDWDPATSTATVRGSFADAHLEFALPAAVHAAGIRLRYVPLDPQTPAPYTSVSWAPDAGSGFEASRRRKVSATGDRHTWGPLVWTRINDPVVTQTAWVDGPVAKIRVAPDLMPGRFRLISLTVLVPAE